MMALPASMTSNPNHTSTSNKYTIMSEINVLTFELLTRSFVSEFIKKYILSMSKFDDFLYFSQKWY